VVYHKTGRMERHIIDPTVADVGVGPRCATLPTTDEEKAARRRAMSPYREGKKPVAEKPAKPAKPVKHVAEKPVKPVKPVKPAVEKPEYPPTIVAYLAATGGELEAAIDYLQGLTGGKRVALGRVAKRAFSGKGRLLANFEGAYIAVTAPRPPAPTPREVREERKRLGRYKRDRKPAGAVTPSRRKPAPVEVPVAHVPHAHVAPPAPAPVQHAPSVAPAAAPAGGLDLEALKQAMALFKQARAK